MTIVITLLRPFLVAYAEATLAGQKKITQQTKSDDIISEYLLRTNGQLFEMNVKIVSSYWQAGKAFDPKSHYPNWELNIFYS